MGVLACDRQDCEIVMCRRYSHRFGYICEDCFDELVLSSDVNIAEFMNSPKVIPDINRDDWREMLEKEFTKD